MLALCVIVTTRWIITCLHGWSGKLWIILLGSGGGGCIGYVIRDPLIIFGGGRGGFLDPRGSVIRGLPTAPCHLNKDRNDEAQCVVELTTIFLALLGQRFYHRQLGIAP